MSITRTHKPPHHPTHLCLRLSNDSQRDSCTETPNSSEARIHQSCGPFVDVQGRGEGDGCAFDHAIRDVARFGEDGTEADTGEDVHVVALSRFMSHPAVRHGLVWATRRINDLAVRPGEG